MYNNNILCKMVIMFNDKMIMDWYLEAQKNVSD